MIVETQEGGEKEMEKTAGKSPEKDVSILVETCREFLELVRQDFCIPSRLFICFIYVSYGKINNVFTFAYYQLNNHSIQ